MNNDLKLLEFFKNSPKKMSAQCKYQTEIAGSLVSFVILQIVANIIYITKTVALGNRHNGTVMLFCECFIWTVKLLDIPLLFAFYLSLFEIPVYFHFESEVEQLYYDGTLLAVALFMQKFSQIMQKSATGLAKIQPFLIAMDDNLQ